MGGDDCAGTEGGAGDGAIPGPEPPQAASSRSTNTRPEAALSRLRNEQHAESPPERSARPVKAAWGSPEPYRSPQKANGSPATLQPERTGTEGPPPLRSPTSYGTTPLRTNPRLIRERLIAHALLSVGVLAASWVGWSGGRGARSAGGTVRRPGSAWVARPEEKMG